MHLVEQQTGDEYIVSRVDTPFSVQASLFEITLMQASGDVHVAGAGRGGVWFFSWLGQSLVLRHYRRGGWAAKCLQDEYVWMGLYATRAYREMSLLLELWQAGLPVPVPIAARIRRAGFWYTADLVMQEIPDAVSLAQYLQQSVLGEDLWRAIGKTLRRFHDYGVWHADLNAHNILLQAGKIYLVDFDKGKIRPGNSVKWRFVNLQRLQRSLLKLRRQYTGFFFEAHHWQQLLSGYQAL